MYVIAFLKGARQLKEGGLVVEEEGTSWCDPGRISAIMQKGKLSSLWQSEAERAKWMQRITEAIAAEARAVAAAAAAAAAAGTPCVPSC